MHSPWRYFTLLPILCVALYCSRAAAAEVYYYDGRSLQVARDGDPQTTTANEWQIWLYSRGKSTGEPDHWGIISARTAAEAVEMLKANQKFEVRYCRFFHHPDDCEQLNTYFNPLGPIAIIGRAQTTPQKVINILMEVTDAKKKLGSLMDLRNALDKPYNPYSYIGHPGSNPYSGMGTVVEGYGKDLVFIVNKIHDFTRDFTKGLDKNMAGILNQLDLFQRSANAFEQGASEMAAGNDRIIKTYNSLQASERSADAAKSRTTPATISPAPIKPSLNYSVIGEWESSSINHHLTINSSGNGLLSIWHVDFAGSSIECRMSGMPTQTNGSSKVVMSSHPACTVSGSPYLGNLPDIVTAEWYIEPSGKADQLYLRGTLNGEALDLFTANMER